MNKFLKLFVLSVSLVTLPLPAFADLKVIIAKESELPFSLSPSNFSNSPSNFSNSVSNFSNSPSNFSNSPSNFSNSSSNFDNSQSGNRRLLLEQGEKLVFIGYYVWGDGGLINFFSSKADRLFYSPSETDALFGGEDGEFCGALATLNDEKVLVLTEKGQLAFIKAGITLQSQPSDRPKQNTGQYPGGGSGHWIQENIGGGSMIILEDGSIWKVDPLDIIEASLWLPISNITVVISNNGSPGYDYLLINTDDGEKAHAKFLGNK